MPPHRRSKQRSKVGSTRSVDMNAALPFKAGKDAISRSRRLATPEAAFNRRYATTTSTNVVPALKRRAKFTPTLRVADIYSYLQFRSWLANQVS
jgi:hypothetical protein